MWEELCTGLGNWRPEIVLSLPAFSGPDGYPPNLRWMREPNFLGRMNQEIPMMKACFTEAEVMGLLRQMESGVLLPSCAANMA